MIDFTLMAPGEITAELGARLKMHRLSLRTTQEELARRAGLNVGTVKNLETKTGACALDTVIRVSFALGLGEHFEHLFEQKPKSIAQMERLAQAPRQRARRLRPS